MDYFYIAEKFKEYNQKLQATGVVDPKNPNPLANGISVLVFNNSHSGMTRQGDLREDFLSIGREDMLKAMAQHLIVHAALDAQKLSPVAGYSFDLEPITKMFDNHHQSMNQNINNVLNIISTDPKVCSTVASCFIDDHINRTGLDKKAYEEYPKFKELYGMVDNYFGYTTGNRQM